MIERPSLLEPTRGTRLRQGFVGQAAYAPVRRDAHAEVGKLMAGSIPAFFDFSNCEESILDRSGAQRIYQDLVEQNGFSDSYESVKRFVRQAAR